ncbi:hypothetical protein [Granulicoccus phenolivorans]|uniref:hypothetical protein n=1 Tax=Granulicoccus phenolivorans TaxID=266854 RepID=UPI0004288CE7|nr:hypothetical protein [Granulicoccus phenolivorans]
MSGDTPRQRRTTGDGDDFSEVARQAGLGRWIAALPLELSRTRSTGLTNIFLGLGCGVIVAVLILMLLMTGSDWITGLVVSLLLVIFAVLTVGLLMVGITRRRRAARMQNQVIYEYADGLVLPLGAGWVAMPYATAQITFDQTPDSSGFFTDPIRPRPSHLPNEGRVRLPGGSGEQVWGALLEFSPEVDELFRTAVVRAYRAQRDSVLGRIMRDEEVTFGSLTVSTAGVGRTLAAPIAWNRIAAVWLDPDRCALKLLRADAPQEIEFAYTSAIANLPLALEALKLAEDLARNRPGPSPREIR